LEDTAPKFVGRVSDSVDGIDDRVHQFDRVEWGAVGEFAFRQGPDPFVGVEVGSVGRKVLEAQAGVATEELSSRTITGPRRWRSSSRRNRHTSSCPMLSKKSR